MTNAETLHTHPVTWVLIADGKKACIYSLGHINHRMPVFSSHDKQNEIRTELSMVPGAEWKAESPNIYEMGNHLLGRTFASVGKSRSAIEPRTDPCQEVKQSFMKNIAQRLEEALGNKSFDQIVLAAPPKMLGELKKHLSKHVSDHVLASVDKDLTHCRPDQLLAHFKNIPLLSDDKAVA